MSKALAAMLAEHDHGYEDHVDPGKDPNGEDPMDGADEGQMAAAEEIMQAFHDQNPKALLEALRSFISMAN